MTITKEHIDKLKYGILSDEEFEEVKHLVLSDSFKKSTKESIDNLSDVESKRPSRILSFTTRYKLPSINRDEHDTYYITISVYVDEENLKFKPFELLIKGDNISDADFHKLIGKTVSFLLRNLNIEGITRYIYALDNLKNHDRITGMWNNGKLMNSRGEMIQNSIEYILDWCNKANALDENSRIIIANLPQEPTSFSKQAKLIKREEITGDCPICKKGSMQKQGGCFICSNCGHTGNCE